MAVGQWWFAFLLYAAAFGMSIYHVAMAKRNLNLCLWGVLSLVTSMWLYDHLGTPWQ